MDAETQITAVKSRRAKFSLVTVAVFSFVGPIFGAIFIFLLMPFVAVDPSISLLSRLLASVVALILLGPFILTFAFKIGLPLAIPTGLIAALLRKHAKTNWRYVGYATIAGAAVTGAIMAYRHTDIKNGSFMVLISAVSSLICAFLTGPYPCRSKGA